ncbi:MAG: poly-gamma-glutamate system protein [Deltaproteobacteria bacterium]|nr:poly-gamma-glutamate system protein [Deltaproteobacteria bacterium]
MAYYRKGRISTRRLIVMAICAAIAMLGIEVLMSTREDPLQEQKLSAVRLMQKAMEVIKEERLRIGIAIDPQLDPNETGLIGVEYTDLTTTLGSLPSKRTSTNPNFAGVVVDMLKRTGARSGDFVAISFSGSFPALNIAVLCATDVLGLRPVIFSSVGSSMYGANLPNLTWLDMERVLIERGILPYKSTKASLGGIVESKGGLDQRGVELGLEAIRRNGIPILEERSREELKEDIARRMGLYDQALDGKKPAVFINVGGSLTALGEAPESYSLPVGLIFHLPPSRHPDRGLIFRMSERGIPVIHLLNIKRIATNYGLPVAPVPLPEAGFVKGRKSERAKGKGRHFTKARGWRLWAISGKPPCGWSIVSWSKDTRLNPVTSS